MPQHFTMETLLKRPHSSVSRVLTIASRLWRQWSARLPSCVATIYHVSKRLRIFHKSSTFSKPCLSAATHRAPHLGPFLSIVHPCDCHLLMQLFDQVPSIRPIADQIRSISSLSSVTATGSSRSASSLDRVTWSAPWHRPGKTQVSVSGW